MFQKPAKFCKQQTLHKDKILQKCKIFANDDQSFMICRGHLPYYDIIARLLAILFLPPPFYTVVETFCNCLPFRFSLKFLQIFSPTFVQQLSKRCVYLVAKTNWFLQKCRKKCILKYTVRVLTDS